MPYEVTRQQIVDAALCYRGARFRHQGRSIETGVDCTGLLEGVLRQVSYPNIVDVEGYRQSPPAQLIRESLGKNFDEIPVDDVGPGDIYLMSIGPGRKAKHASILISDKADVEQGLEPEIIHAYGLGGSGSVVVEPLSQWRHRCVAGFRLRGLVG